MAGVLVAPYAHADEDEHDEQGGRCGGPGDLQAGVAVHLDAQFVVGVLLV